MQHEQYKQPTVRVMKRFVTIATACVVMTAATPMALAMSAPAHLGGLTDEGVGGMFDLMGTPPEAGGVGSMTREKLQAIQEWMDRPASMLDKGQTNWKAGGRPLSPLNHRFQRHDAAAVARALSGNGTEDLAHMNAARVHILGDVATGKAPVNGWEITADMQDEARQALRHVRARGALPSELPKWMHGPGPLMSSTGTAGAASAKATRAVGVKPPVRVSTSGAKAARAIGKCAGPVAVAAGAGVIAYEAWSTETQYANGQISEDERDAAHARTAGTAVGGSGGAIGGAAAGAAIGTAVCPGPGTAVGAVVGSVVGAAGGGYGGGKGAGKVCAAAQKATAAERQRAQDAIADACLGPALSLSPDEYKALGIEVR